MGHFLVDQPCGGFFLFLNIMKYQLVLQLPGSDLTDFDALLELEEELIEILGNLGYVDGHDAGAGEMNIFIHTNDPAIAFERVKNSQRGRRCLARLKAAFREIGNDDYTILYPRDLTSFSVT